MALSRHIRRSLRLLGASIAYAASLSFASAGPPRPLRFAYILPAGSQLGVGAQAFADEIAKRTGGRFTIEQYPNAMLGGEVAALDALKAGAIDLAFVTGAPLPKVVQAAGIFNIPFLFRDAAEARHLLDGPVGEDYLRQFDAAGIHALAWGENGMRQLTTAKRAVSAPSDLVGLTLRLPQSDVMEAGFRALGAKVEQIPFPQVFAALRTGTVEGQENPLGTIVSSRFYEVQDHLTLTDHVYDPAVILMSEDDWLALSPADRESFVVAAHAGAEASRAYAERLRAAELATVRSAGVEVIERVDRDAFARAAAGAEPVYERLFGRQAIERVRMALSHPDGARLPR